MAKVNDFVSELTERYGLSPEDADGFITMMFDVISGELDSPDKQVKVKGLGTFKVTSVGARASVDVNTGERIVLEGRNKISFTPDVVLRDRVNRPFAQFETVVLNDGVDFSEIDREFDESRKAESDTVDDGDSATADEDMAEAADEENDADFGQDDSNAEETAEDRETADETAEGEKANESDAATVAESDADAVVESCADTKSSADAVSETGVASLIGAEPQNVEECHACEKTDAKAAASIAVETPDDEPDANANADAAAPTDVDAPVDADSSVGDNEPVNSDEQASSDESISSEESVGTDGPTDEDGVAESNKSINFDETAGSDDVAVNNVPVGADGSRMVCKQRNPRVMYWLTAASFALLVCIGIGMYFLYRQMEAKNEAIEQLQSRLAAHAEKTKPVAALPAKVAPVRQQEKAKPVAEKHPTAAVAAEGADVKNTGPKAMPTENDMQKKPDASAESKKPTEKKSAAKDVKPATAATSDYSKDVRIRTGAYVIVGTETTVTVRKGQTLASISKANLGPGMECYVEAYNNVKTVKVGDKLKIPKLKLKKRL